MSETSRSSETTSTTVTSEAAPATTAREVLGWEQFGEAARELARAVVRSGWMPDVVVAVARGGLVPAGAVAYALDVKAMGTLNVEFYTGVAETLPEPVVLPPLMDTSDLPGRRVLVVDDVADSGRTLALVMDMIRAHGLPADADGEARPVEARSAVIYAKPRSVIEPDYVWRHTDRWINFPWSAQPPVTTEV
ncbi:phosphoribosyltransferase [Georgenia thermotolerans]|uniref:Phosphoribosyltransferase n=1 Tax=Georgenia thermotolerans TaxID=527326 RepID=A0A7J5URH6_9MICO|nr:phosphoribosyltransferase [Georgenia thermotolerans]KAE8764734.1 phosphoribosyltransferase [Georgenia thermotolerans]